MRDPGTVHVHTPVGDVIGQEIDGIVDFVGVRYGDRLTSERFAEVADPLTAQSAATAFPQKPGGLDWLLGQALSELPQSEDAFVLRVQAPAQAFENGTAASASLPVLVFIPGGGFLSGGAHARWFEQTPLVTAGLVILVTVNYRIGALGHFGAAASTTDANRGLRDLKQALRWIHENIAAFGGDPERVTLGGDSAGAWYAWALSQDQELAGMFARTLLLSLPYEAPLNAAAYEARREVFQQQLDALESDLESCSTDDLLSAQMCVAKEFLGKGMAVMPAVAAGELAHDFAEVRSQARNVHTEAVALLTTADEAAAFLGPVPEPAFTEQSVAGYLGSHFVDPDTAAAVLLHKRESATAKLRMIDALTLFQFRSMALEVVRELSQAGKAAWVAQLSAQSGLPGAYAPHGFALPFIFGNRERWHDAPMLTGVTDGSYAVVSEALREWILGFVIDRSPKLWGEVLTPFAVDLPLSLEIDEAGGRLEAPAEWAVVARREH